MKTQVLQDVAEVTVTKQHSSNALRCNVKFNNGETFSPVVGTWTAEGREFGKLLYSKLDEVEEESAYRRRTRRAISEKSATERACILDPEKVIIGYEPYEDLDGNKGERRVLVGGAIIEVKNIDLEEEANKSLESLLKKSTKAVMKKDKEGNISFVDEKPAESSPKAAPAAPKKGSSKKSTK